MKLYEIAGELAQVMRLIEAADGEMPPEVETHLDQLNMDFLDKVESICGLIKEQAAETVILRTEADRMLALARAKARNVDRMKNYIKTQMELAGRDALETGFFKVKICANARPTILCNVPVEETPSQYVRVVLHVDTQAAYETWQRGEPLPDCFQVRTGSHLRIS